ncbi:intradiol ring-cleavage dioxygenase [Bacterioplanoides sp.]|uniref:dioxygenase family protein n=1 Tax=Bacterioplanoides sp. TaxID=2066072 RepID=UPI003B5A038C
MQPDKRSTLKLLGVSTLALSIPSLVACGSSSSGSTPATTLPPPPKRPVNWLSGGTDLIQANFPNDDVFSANTPCQVDLFPTSIEGPCYFRVDNREDISDNTDGLPMQICLQIIDRQCRPLSGYTVEIWHCDKRGVYSANTAASADARRFDTGFCTNGDTPARSSRWGRGELTTDSNGRVNFKSCFPGWYPGRTAHIHFRVKQGSRESLVSQLRFSDALCHEIYTTHDRYSSRGNQDTSIPADGEFTNNDSKGFTLSQNSDGSLLAVKQIQVNL